MECVLHAKLPYTDLAGMLRAQKAALDARMRSLSNSHVVHVPPPRAVRALPKEEAHPQQREVPVPLDVGAIPGVAAAGWRPDNAPAPRWVDAAGGGGGGGGGRAKWRAAERARAASGSHAPRERSRLHPQALPSLTTPTTPAPPHPPPIPPAATASCSTAPRTPCRPARPRSRRSWPARSRRSARTPTRGRSSGPLTRQRLLTTTILLRTPWTCHSSSAAWRRGATTPASRCSSPTCAACSQTAGGRVCLGGPRGLSPGAEGLGRPAPAAAADPATSRAPRLQPRPPPSPPPPHSPPFPQLLQHRGDPLLPGSQPPGGRPRRLHERAPGVPGRRLGGG
jgi:hypothetical protein